MTENNLIEENQDNDIQEKSKNKVTLADTITVQIILILIIAISYLLVNTFTPKISNDVYSTFTYYLQQSAEDCYKSISTGIINILEEANADDNTSV